MSPVSGVLTLSGISPKRNSRDIPNFCKVLFTAHVEYAALPRVLFVNGKIMPLLTDQIEGTKSLESTAKALKNLRLSYS
jgi:hypothetical protein